MSNFVPPNSQVTGAPPAFLFVINPLDFESALPINIDGACNLRRATEAEIIQIKQFLGWFKSELSTQEFRYETDPLKTVSGPNTQITRASIPREKWRYTVISFPEYNESIRKLEICGTLLNPPMEFGCYVQPFRVGVGEWSWGYGHQRGKVSGYFENTFFEVGSQLMPDNQITLLRECWQLTEKSSPESFVLKALKAFDDTRFLPRHSDAATLSYFGILESLLTHIPDPKDTLDSITRQLRNKMKLLGRYFVRPLVPTIFFDSAEWDNKKLWSRLYEYRSRLAHGGSIDFSAKDFKAFKSRESVSEFLKEALRLVLIEGIRDEEFLSDLRDC